MGSRKTYVPGTFSWVGLATADVPAAKAFYGGLFGWQFEGDPTNGAGASHTVARIGVDSIAGLLDMPAESAATGVAPYWISYVSVVDADATAAQARALGATVVNDPSDVGPVGRAAVLRDPQGAAFALWQAGTRVGADRVNDPGCLCMNELITTDLDEARSFYEQLFGWTIDRVDLGAGAPAGFALLEGRVNASVFETSDAVPPYWRACFAVESTTPAVERVRKLGGEIEVEAVDIGDGSLAVVRDDHGAVFSLFAGETDD